MNCNCIKEIENKVKDSFKEQNKEYTGELTSKMGGQFFVFSEKSSILSLSLPVVIEYNRQTKTGKLQKKTKEYSMLFTYCPYCGEKINKE